MAMSHAASDATMTTAMMANCHADNVEFGSDISPPSQIPVIHPRISRTRAEIIDASAYLPSPASGAVASWLAAMRSAGLDLMLSVACQCRNGHKFWRHPIVSPLRAGEDVCGVHNASLAAASPPPHSHR